MVDELPSDSTDPKYRLTPRHLIPALVINNANHGTCTTHNHSYYVEASFDTTTIPAPLDTIGTPWDVSSSTNPSAEHLAAGEVSANRLALDGEPQVSILPAPWHAKAASKTKGGGANTHNMEAMVKSTRKIHINQHKSLKDMFHPCHKSSCQPAKILRAEPAK